MKQLDQFYTKQAVAAQCPCLTRKEVRTRLWEMDFEKLSHNNTITPGFGKADIVREYEGLYGT